MLPKKIYLNYVDESDTDKTWSEKPISVCDCQMQNREYTDLSSLWHDVSEEPQGNYWKILCQDEEGGCWVENRANAMLSYNTWDEYAATELVDKWAYINDLLPKNK